MISRLVIEALIGLAAICAAVPLALRFIFRARREVKQIVDEEGLSFGTGEPRDVHALPDERKDKGRLPP